MKKIVIATLFAGSTLLMADGAALFAKCAGCHGQKGEKAALGKSAIIGGEDAAKTIELLKGYKAGTLNQHGMGQLMKGQVASMSDEDIKAVAEYIAGLK
ncbi:MAG: c-type cytochrome [Sulfurovum sp.]|nr:c-type cytochrome [Sulfurovum sp.]